jgi:hypothetical protein
MFVLNYSLTREREGENEPTQDKKKKKKKKITGRQTTRSPRRTKRKKEPYKFCVTRFTGAMMIKKTRRI